MSLATTGSTLTLTPAASADGCTMSTLEFWVEGALPQSRESSVSEAPSKTVSTRTQAQLLLDILQEAKDWKSKYYVGTHWTPASTNNEELSLDPQCVVPEKLQTEISLLESKFFGSLSQLNGEHAFGGDTGLFKGDTDQGRNTRRLTLELFAEQDVVPTLKQALDMTLERGSAFRDLTPTLSNLYNERTKAIISAAATSAGLRMPDEGQTEGGIGG